MLQKRKAPRPPKQRARTAAPSGFPSAAHVRDKYDWITLGATVAGVAIVAVSTCFTAWQAYVTQRQLDGFIEQQRAWVTVDAIPANGIEISSSGVTGEVLVHLKNVGNEPATNVAINVIGFVFDTDKHPSACDKKDDELGGTLFPAEEFNDRYKFFISPTDWVNATMNSGEGSIMISVCTRYSSGSIEKRRRTERTFIVSQNNKEKLNQFEVEPHIINRENLYLGKTTIQESPY